MEYKCNYCFLLIKLVVCWIFLSMKCNWSYGYGKRCDCNNDFLIIYVDINVF